MRFQRLDLEAFGRFRGFRADRLGGLVVVFGPNEAGKSTFVEACRTVLYGFRPASREGNPYVPWGEEEARVAAGLRLGDGSCVQVERRLRSQPSGRLLRGEDTELVGNRPLPWVTHIPRDVYAELFRLSPDTGPAVGDGAWSEIQARLIGTMGSTDIRTPRDVAEELEEEADAIRRPNRRGKQALRMLDEELGRLRARLREAVRSDEEVRRLRDELAEKEAELEAARVARAEARALLERAHHDADALRTLERIDTLRASSLAPEKLEGFPPDPAAELRRLEMQRADAEAEFERLNRDLEDARARAEGLQDHHQALLAERDSVRALPALVARMEAAEEDAAASRDRLTTLEVSLDAASEGLLSVPGRELEPELLEGVDLARLGALDAGAPEGVPPASVGAAWAMVAGGAAAALLAGLAGAPLTRTLLAVAAAVFLSTGGALAWLHRRHRRQEELRTRQRQTLLQELPLTEAARALPAGELSQRLTRLRELLVRRREARAALVEAEKRVADLAARLEEALRRVSVDVAGGGPGDLRQAIERAQASLREAEAEALAAEAARRELTRLSRRREELEARLEEIDAPLKALRDRLAGVGEGDPAAGLARVQESLAAQRDAARLEEELEARVGDLDAYRKKATAAGGPGHDAPAPADEEIYRAEARLEQLDERIDRLHEEIAQIREQLERLAEAESPDEVLGAIQELEERRRALIHRHDRLRALAALVRQVDRRFRAEHQPDVFRRAGAYLRRLTGGRYEVLTPEDDPDRARFQLEGVGIPEARTLEEPLSRGTREQAYFALRMGILDHLDAAGERLPLFIDEGLVHWDAERRAEALRILSEAAGDRQIFVLTCHADLADALVREGAARIDLTGP